MKYLIWLTVGKSSKILVKYVGEIRPDCRNLATKVHNNGKFEIFLGGVLKVHSRCVGLKIWVGQGFLL